MPITVFKPDEVLDEIDGVSNSARRSSFITCQEVVALHIEAHHDDARDCFNNLNLEVLPRLPHGYRWVEVENQFAVMKDVQAPDHHLKLIIYGPDAKSQINYLFQVDNVTTFGFAHTRKTKEPKSRRYPMTQDQYRVPGYAYQEHDFSAHVRGHIIDHKDTIREVGLSSAWSTYDGRNYVPEPPDYAWGQGVRKQKVAEVRKKFAAYSQFMEYGEGHHVTVGGTPVPTAIYFTSFRFDREQQYQPTEVFNVEFDEDLSRPNKRITYLKHAKKTFVTSPEAAPVVVPYSPSSTDRTLRLLRFNAVRRAEAIATGNVQSRFPARDELYAHGDAADIEVGSISRRVLAAEFAGEAGDSETGLGFMNRALALGETQMDGYDVDAPIFDINAHKRGQSFFAKHSDTPGIEGLEDHFEQLWKNHPSSE
ncbi:MAG: hypothetical protein CMF39_02375 [Legionellaceae bacterium]|nr:hypothetical protein [Legionellaceae bacterium]